MLPVRTSSLHKSISVESLVHFQAYILVLRIFVLSSLLSNFEPTCSLRESTLVESLVYFSSILALRVYFSRVSRLFFEPVSLIHESNQLSILSIFQASMLRKYFLFESPVYFLSLHPRLAGLFQSSLLSIFRIYILTLRVFLVQLN